MATPFSDVYEHFLPKVTDYAFLSLAQSDLEDQLETIMNTSIVKFRRCKTNLSNRDKILKVFNEDLSDIEKEILSVLMVVDYLTPKLVTADLLQQTLNSKDFRVYSQANHIKEIRELRDMMRKEADKLMIDYSYISNSLDDMR